VFETELEAAESRPLTGCRILVVEDEYFIAEEIKVLLVKLGAVVIGPLSDQFEAIEVLSDVEIDCAVLDIDIRGRAVFPLTRALRQRDIPWLYASGYSESLVPEEWRGRAHVEKPIVSEALVASIQGILR
jgi:CheY-like chemotaxis protein